MGFYSNQHCDMCALAEGCKSVCIKTARYGPIGTSEEITPSKDRAVLVVGEAPGANEDEKGRPFVGQAGMILRDVYLDYFKLPELVDVYLGNAVRCRPPQNETPGVTSLKACGGYLLADIAELQKYYKEVIILAVGAPAVRSVWGESLKKSFSMQGDVSDFSKLYGKTIAKWGPGIERVLGESNCDWPEPCRVFSTYHPQALRRVPSRGASVETHLSLLRDFLEGNLEYQIGSDLHVEEAPTCPSPCPKFVVLDIETYGFILDRPTQTQFHPLKSATYDGVGSDAVATVGITWKDGGTYRHGIFVMDRQHHRVELRRWVQRMEREGCSLGGHNLPFDLMYLRHFYPILKQFLNPRLRIRDTMILNYLLDEGRVEKSLKNLSPLYRITKYEEHEDFQGVDDPKLWYYNCQDTYATYLLHDTLADRIRGYYGADTPKLTPESEEWYSDLLWLVTRLSETGVKVDMPRLDYLHKHYEARRLKIEGLLARERGLVLHGKGSVVGKRQLIDAAVELAGNKCPKLALTAKTKEISFNEENRNALLDVLPRSSVEAQNLRLLGRLHSIGGVLDRYLYPIRVGRGKDHKDRSTKAIDGFIYPQWYAVPSDWEDGSTGGTKQSRIVARVPAVQTFPPSIKDCMVPRYPKGFFVWCDYSQVELVTAALLSGDEAMMAEYMKEETDLHGSTARLIFGEEIVHHPKYKDVYRQAGKTLNFLILFRGGAEKFRQTLMQQVGLDYPTSKCQAAIEAFRHQHPGLIAWQDETIKFVKTHGYFQIPLLGQSRLYWGGKREVDEAVNEIVNQQVQTVAANITLSSHVTLFKEATRLKLKTVFPVNIYDAIAIDGPAFERHSVSQLVERVLPNPPYYEKLCELLGRRLPLRYEMKVAKGKFL